ncbi:hypothetical protein TNCV_585761 [Trichonephila clavipes]|nr:hypothetical protein TNCV_585761 [Trichonephila clavipes]
MDDILPGAQLSKLVDKAKSKNGSSDTPLVLVDALYSEGNISWRTFRVVGEEEPANRVLPSKSYAYRNV